MWRGLFSISVRDTEYFKANQSKFELVGGCPKDRGVCMHHLSVINKSFASSLNYHLNKDYPHSIESLQYAYNVTHQFEETSCTQCVRLFRSSIIESLENIRIDLQKMTTGVFAAKRHKPSFEMANLVLEKFRKEIADSAISA